MGWQMENVDSEGWVAGLVREGESLRELGHAYGDDEPRADVVAVQAACECGWRGPLLHGAEGTWVPYVVDVDRRVKTRLARQWEEHASSSCPRRLPPQPVVAAPDELQQLEAEGFTVQLEGAHCRACGKVTPHFRTVSPGGRHSDWACACGRSRYGDGTPWGAW